MDSELESWIHPPGSGIRIRQKVNTSGTDPFGTSYQVDIPEKITGGKRIRKQFAEKDDAEAFADKQFKGLRKQGESYFKTTDRERNAFVAVIPQLRDAGIDLEEAVAFALQRMKPEGGDKTLKEIVQEMTVSKTNSFNRGNLSNHSLGTFKTRSNTIVAEFGDVLIKDLTLDGVKKWLMAMDCSKRTIQNFVMSLGEIINHGKRNKYVSENILDALSSSDRRELYGQLQDVQPEILTIEETRRLISAAYNFPQLGLDAAVTLGLFCGLRTEEIRKLEWNAVDLDRGFVTIGASIAKKRRLRNTTIPKNAIAFLRTIKDRSGMIVKARDKNHYHELFKNLLREAKFIAPNDEKTSDRRTKTVWKKNAMRHSFGTYHFSLHEDSIKTSNELGHRQGDNILFANYRALATKEQGEEYFAIVPAASNDVVVNFAG